MMENERKAEARTGSILALRTSGSGHLEALHLNTVSAYITERQRRIEGVGDPRQGMNKVSEAKV